MIVYPKDYDKIDFVKCSRNTLVKLLSDILRSLKVVNLAYSGGIDSSILLCLLTYVSYPENIHTYTIACREDHPDILYAKYGAKYYGLLDQHIHTYIVPELKDGDEAVYTLCNRANMGEMICGDGIDELSCGYYDHEGKYEFYLSRVIEDHLKPLNKNSGNTKIFLPYLDDKIINILVHIPLEMKYRKQVIKAIAYELKLPKELIERNKYGFCDAILKEDK